MKIEKSEQKHHFDIQLSLLTEPSEKTIEKIIKNYG
jgi:hypothetical protein